MVLKPFISYLESEKRYSLNTVTSYHSDLKLLAVYLATNYDINDWKEVDTVHLRSWVVAMSADGVTPRSIRRKISAVRHLYKYLKKKREVAVNPAHRLITPKTGKRLPEVVSADNLGSIREEGLFPDGFSGIRDRLIMQLLYFTGMRRAELLGLSTGDIDLVQQQLKVFGKGGKERWVPFINLLGDTIRQYFASYREEFGESLSGRLIVTDKGKPAYPKFIYNKVNHYLGVISTASKRSPHVLRHSFATHLSDEGADLQAIKELLGHANLAATQIYTHNSVEKLKKVYEQAHPKSGK